MAVAQNTRLGIMLMIPTTMIFAMQDAISRHLGQTYNVFMVVMIRYWFFAAFVIVMAARAPGGLRAAVRTRHPWLQSLRGLLLVCEIAVVVISFVRLGLVETHAVFTSSPLIVAALSGPILGEKVGWRRWTAIGIGCIGVLIALDPGAGVFSGWSVLPLIAAGMFAVYGLLTRYVGRQDSAAVSFFWTGLVGALAATALGLPHLQAMTGADAALMAVLCCTACLSHWMLIRVYEIAEASAVQPFAYLQLVWVSMIGVAIFHEVLRPNVV
ncbi:MAG: DMT family transporter, partial [Paracoccaceae bacterium]